MTREELKADDLKRARALAWLTGWRNGAAFLPVPEQYLNNADYADGWKAGRDECKRARKVAEEKFGHRFQVVSIANALAHSSGGEDV